MENRSDDNHSVGLHSCKSKAPVFGSLDPRFADESLIADSGRLNYPPFMSLSFAPSVILPDSTTPVDLDPGALDVIRPCLEALPAAQHALAALCSSWVPGRIAFVHASPMPHVHRTLR